MFIATVKLYPKLDVNEYDEYKIPFRFRADFKTAMEINKMLEEECIKTLEEMGVDIKKYARRNFEFGK